MNNKRLRYVCDRCGDSHVTARGHAKHADRDHQSDHVESTRKWVVVE